MKWLDSGLSRRSFIAASGSTLGLAACSKSAKTLRFAGLPYGDHSQAVIGIQQGFFAKAGINLQYDTIKVEQAVTLL